MILCVPSNTSQMGNFKKNEDFSVIKFFVNLKDDIHIHFI